MAQIRNTIELLSKILTENGTCKMKAESFRLAKFNQIEAVGPFWHLLFEMICYCEYNKIDELTVEAFNQLSSEEVVVYVKQEMQKRGFYSTDFIRLPNDMTFGSRELLLSFGFLMSKESIINRFIMNRTTSLDNDDTIAFYEDDLKETKKRNDLMMNLSKFPSDIYSRLQQLLWLNNKLRLSLCSLHSMQCQRLRLKHKIHEVKSTASHHQLSMLEVYLVRNPQFLIKNIELLDEDSERLNNLLEWRDHEGIFWKWMENVFEMKLSMEEEEERQEVTSSNEAMMSSASKENKDCHDRLHNSIVKYEAIVEHLERLCKQNNSEVTSEELDQIVSAINLELSLQKANISLLGIEKNEKKIASNWKNWFEVNINEPRFVMEKKLQKPEKEKTQMNRRKPVLMNNSFSSILSSVPAGYASHSDIDDEINSLELLVSNIETELNQTQSQLKKEIEHLSSKLTDTVCIPPLNRNLKIFSRT